MGCSVSTYRLIKVNPVLLDRKIALANNQPMVEKTETFSDRFEQLRAGMSYQALSDAISRKSGIRISAQAMHKWSKGGGIEQDKLKLVAEFFGVNEAWLMYGSGPLLQQAVGALSENDQQQVLDFIEYKIARTEALVANDRSVDYMKMISRIREDMKRRLSEIGRASCRERVSSVV